VPGRARKRGTRGMTSTLSLPMRGLMWLTCISFRRRTMASSPRSTSRRMHRRSMRTRSGMYKRCRCSCSWRARQPSMSAPPPFGNPSDPVPNRAFRLSDMLVKDQPVFCFGSAPRRFGPGWCARECCRWRVSQPSMFTPPFLGTPPTMCQRQALRNGGCHGTIGRGLADG